jgi:hypothetical protein
VRLQLVQKYNAVPFAFWHHYLYIALNNTAGKEGATITIRAK